MTTAAVADVVVVSWNQRDLTLECLARLATQTVPVNVVLVDNASEDGTVDAVRARFPDVTVLETGANLGFGRGVNHGVRASRSDVVVLVNNDLFVEQDFVEKIVEPLGRPEVGMVAGLTLLPGDGSRVDRVGVLLDRSLCAFSAGRHASPEHAATLQVHLPSGGAAAYRRSAFEAAGGFDDLLFAYGEDVDLGLRIALAGWHCAVASGARGVHIGGASTSSTRRGFRQHLSGTARGFLLRRYRLGLLGVLQAVLTEPPVVLADIIRSRSLQGLRGRVHGWRLAASRGPRLRLPAFAVDRSIGPVQSIRLRLRQ